MFVDKKFGFIILSYIYYVKGDSMNGLFLFSFNNIFANLSRATLALICGFLVVLLSIICSIICIKKENYGILKRLWLVLSFVGISLIEHWLEGQIKGEKSYIILTVGLCFLSLSICLFLPEKKVKLSDEKRTLAQFLDKCAHGKLQDNDSHFSGGDFMLGKSEVMPSKVFSSPIMQAKSINKTSKQNVKGQNDEIDFSHVKSILARLEFYPLKEQDKKSAEGL